MPYIPICDDVYIPCDEEFNLLAMAILVAFGVGAAWYMWWSNKKTKDA